MGKRKISVKEMKPRAEAAQALRECADALESGTLTMADGKEEIEITVPDDVKLTLKGKLKGAKGKMTLSVSWKESPTAVVLKEESVPAVKKKASPPAKAKPKKSTSSKKPDSKKKTEKKAPQKAPQKAPKKVAKKGDSKAAAPKGTAED